MPITQIPFQDPVAPPEKPQPEQQPGLYDQQDWETAYRDLDAHVPHLLIQLQDDLERSRWREALWLSIIVHLVLAIALWNLPLIEKTLGWHHVVVVPMNSIQDKNTTFLALPPDCRSPRAGRIPTLLPIKIALRLRGILSLIPRNCARVWRPRHPARPD